ncbi:MAG: ATP-binding protein, partial [Bacteroidota bacterium]
GGALWLGTDRGLSRFDPVTETVATFTSADGLHGDVIDLMSSAKAADGTLFMGGPDGFTGFDPSSVAARQAGTPVQFSSVIASGVRRAGVTAGDTVRLSHDLRQLAVEFATLDFTAPSRTEYRYRLLPYETTWTNADARSAEARYAAVPPGEYVLEVLSSGPNGGFGETPSRLYVHAPPLWWERASIQLLGLILALGGVGAIGWRATQRAERRRAEAAEVARRLAASREDERLRLAREIHDGAVQHLYRTGHDLDVLAETAGVQAVAPVRASLDEAAGDLRAVLADLRPPQVGTLGAAAAVRAAVDRFSETYPEVQIDLDLAVTGRRWPASIQHAAVRIVQEALSNAGRHAEASALKVRLAEAGEHAIVEVADDGVGFDTGVSAVDHVRGGHFGLAGLRERAAGLDGTVEVASAPGRGTRILARLPLTPLAPAATRWIGDVSRRP